MSATAEHKSFYAHVPGFGAVRLTQHALRRLADFRIPEPQFEKGLMRTRDADKPGERGAVVRRYRRLRIVIWPLSSPAVVLTTYLVKKRSAERPAAKEPVS